MEIGSISKSSVPYRARQSTFRVRARSHLLLIWHPAASPLSAVHAFYTGPAFHTGLAFHRGPTFHTGLAFHTFTNPNSNFHFPLVLPLMDLVPHQELSAQCWNRVFTQTRVVKSMSHLRKNT